MVESVINDLDGTLLDSMEAVFRTYSIISEKPIEYIREMYQPDWRRFEREANMPKVSAVEWHRLFERQCSNVKLFPGAQKYLRKIKNDGYKTALVTSSNSLSVKAKLKEHKLYSIFDIVVTSDDVKELKPNPESLIIAARNLNSEIKECVSVGDTNADATASKSIGMKFIGVGWGYHSPEVIRKVNGDKIASNFEELYMMIKRV